MHWNWGKILGWTVASLDGCASIGYFFASDWKRGILWFCWGLGTAMVNIL